MKQNDLFTYFIAGMIKGIVNTQENQINNYYNDFTTEYYWMKSYELGFFPAIIFLTQRYLLMNNQNYDPKLVNYYINEIEKQQNSSIKTNIDPFYNKKDNYILPNFDVDALYDLCTNPKLKYLNYILISKLYFDGKTIEKDINKAIYLLTTLANEKLWDLNDFYLEKNPKYISDYINENVERQIISFDMNIISSQTILGFLKLQDPSVTRNIPQAIHYLTSSANNKDPVGQLLLGFIYSQEKFGELNIQKAIHYLELALNDDHPQIDSIHQFYFKSQKYCFNKIARWFDYFLGQNLDVKNMAQNLLGNIFYNGKGIMKDINKAIYYFELSAKQKEPKALYNLAVIHFSTEHGMFNIEKGMKYMESSAIYNYVEAQVFMGYIYLTGFFIQQNTKKAIYYFELAQFLNNDRAQFYLGVIYYIGIHTKQDMEKAKYNFMNSSNKENKYAKNNYAILFNNDAKTIDILNEIIDDPIARFNLAHIYVFGKFKKYDQSIEILIRPGYKKVPNLYAFLCVIIFEKYQAINQIIKQELIEDEFKKYNPKSYKKLASGVMKTIKFLHLRNPMKYRILYNKIQDMKLIYVDYLFGLLGTYHDVNYIEQVRNGRQNHNHFPNIGQLFYEGFQIDIET